MFLPLLSSLLGLAGVLGIVWLLLAVKGTVGWSLSGEAGALLHSGFATAGRRLRRTIRIRSIVGHVALAARLNLPLPAALRAAARGETKPVAASLRYIAYLVGAGWSVSEAVAAGVEGCPPLLTAVLRKGELCGQLARALEDVEGMLADATHDISGRSGLFRRAGTYAMLMLGFCLGFASLVMWKVVPRLKTIFLDFDTPLPWLTVTLIDAFDFLFGSLPGIIILFAVLPLVLLCFAFGCLTEVARMKNAQSPGMLLGAIGVARWMFPITRRTDFALGMATASRTLSLSLRSGLPLERSVDLAATVGGANHLRCRLADFAADVHAGIPPHAAAQRARLGAVFTSALAMIERGEDPGAALGHAAEYYRAIANRWRDALSAVGVPVATLLSAGLVAYLALALFLPLVHLTNSVMESML